MFSMEAGRVGLVQVKVHIHHLFQQQIQARSGKKTQIKASAYFIT
jgi:hypothetical protein